MGSCIISIKHNAVVCLHNSKKQNSALSFIILFTIYLKETL